MDKNCERICSRSTVIIACALLLLFWGLLVLEGRPAWCKFGLGFWSAAWTHCTSQHLLDPYSLTHMLHGVIFYWLLRPLASRVELRWRLIAALGLEMAWELLENSPWVIERYRQATASLDYTGDEHVPLTVEKHGGSSPGTLQSREAIFPLKGGTHHVSKKLPEADQAGQAA